MSKSQTAKERKGKEASIISPQGKGREVPNASFSRILRDPHATQITQPLKFKEKSSGQPYA